MKFFQMVALIPCFVCLTGCYGVPIRKQISYSRPPIAGERRSVAVRATEMWKPSGVLVHRGDEVFIEASGQWHMGFGWPIAGPEGYRGGTYPQPLAVQDQLIGTLCARIDLGKAFKVGSQLYLQEVQRDGELQFICNDSVGYSFDNWGQVLVTVLVKRKTSGRELTGKVSCDLRIIDVSKGSGIASAGGETASNKIDLLARGLAGKLKESMVIKGEPIAVVSLRNRSRTNQGKIIADELADKVQGALIDTGWFDVKERIDLRAVLDEKDLDTAGIVKNDSVRKKLSGVKYIVIGGVTVTEPPKQ